MNMDLIEELRDKVLARDESYKRKKVMYYNKRVKNRQFWAGDLVLRWVEATGYIPCKLNPTWEGPFKVTKIARPRSY